MSHSGPENFKKSRYKKLVKSNKSISRKNLLNIFHNKTEMWISDPWPVRKTNYMCIYDNLSFMAIYDDL